MKKIAVAWALAVLSLAFQSGPAWASSSYLSGTGGFNKTYPSSTTGSNAGCNLCHSSGSGTPLNVYGKDWAVQHNSGIAVQAAYKAIESLNSDGDPTASTNLAEITANAQPGWTPGPKNTLYDMGSFAVVATAQNPPAIAGNVLDPAAVAAVNHAPLLAAIGARSASEGVQLTFTAAATDPDGNALTFSGGNLPAGATLSVGGVFKWTPDYFAAGNYSATITVTDNGVPPLSASEVVTITVGNVNRPPVPGAIAASQSASHGATTTITITANDPDGDALAFAGSNLPSGATLTDNMNSTATFAWMPAAAQTGAFPKVTVTVTDKGSPPQSATAQFTITVVDGNQPPVLAPIGARTASPGVPLAFQATATDPNPADTLTFSGGNLPAGAALTPAGAFSWTPAGGLTGSFPVTVTVTDSGAPPQTDSETFNITVGGVNQPPVMAPIGARTVAEGQLLAFTASASDADGNALTFTGTNLPVGATLSPAGAFGWTPDFTQAGSYGVTITVSDGASTAAEKFTITVGDVNRPPVLAPSPIGDRTVAAGQSLTIAITASDPDGGALSFGSANLPSGATLAPNGANAASFKWTPTAAQAGSYPNVSIAVSDGDLSDAEMFTITVTPAGGVVPPAAGSVSVSEAAWGDSRLSVKGKVKPAGATVTLIDADTGKTLAAASSAKGEKSLAADGSGAKSSHERGDTSGDWKLDLKLDAAPCRVQAKAGGQSSRIIAVRNAPKRCRPDSQHDD